MNLNRRVYEVMFPKRGACRNIHTYIFFQFSIFYIILNPENKDSKTVIFLVILKRSILFVIHEFDLIECCHRNQYVIRLEPAATLRGLAIRLCVELLR